jgi:hypothetical protein
MGYGSKTHYNGSQNGDTTASSGRELYYLQFSLQAARPETFGYTLVWFKAITFTNISNNNFSGYEPYHLVQNYRRFKDSLYPHYQGYDGDQKNAKIRKLPP